MSRERMMRRKRDEPSLPSSNLVFDLEYLLDLRRGSNLHKKEATA